MVGYIQKQIIEIGKKKGFVSVFDIAKFYSKDRIEIEMNKLVALGYFEEPQDNYSIIKWFYILKEAENEKKMSQMQFNKIH